MDEDCVLTSNPYALGRLVIIAAYAQNFLSFLAFFPPLVLRRITQDDLGFLNTYTTINLSSLFVILIWSLVRLIFPTNNPISSYDASIILQIGWVNSITTFLNLSASVEYELQDGAAPYYWTLYAEGLKDILDNAFCQTLNRLDASIFGTTVPRLPMRQPRHRTQAVYDPNQEPLLRFVINTGKRMARRGSGSMNLASLQLTFLSTIGLCLWFSPPYFPTNHGDLDPECGFKFLELSVASMRIPFHSTKLRAFFLAVYFLSFVPFFNVLPHIVGLVLLSSVFRSIFGRWNSIRWGALPIFVILLAAFPMLLYDIEMTLILPQHRNAHGLYEFRWELGQVASLLPVLVNLGRMIASQQKLLQTRAGDISEWTTSRERTEEIAVRVDMDGDSTVQPQVRPQDRVVCNAPHVLALTNAHNHGGHELSPPHASASDLGSEYSTAPSYISAYDIMMRELEECVVALRDAQYSPSFDEVGQRLFDLLDSDVLSTQESYQRFLQYTEEMAQLLVNALQWILQFHPSLEGPQKRKFLAALLRLSKRNLKLPSGYDLSDIQIGEVVFQTDGVDIHKGEHQGRVVCLKKYRACTADRRAEAAKMTIKEAILWFNYAHIGILPFKGVFQVGPNFENLFFVSPFLKNGTVVDFMGHHSDVIDRRLLVWDVLRAVAYLHENMAVHGDIKGSNILVNGCGRAVLADLGLSRLSDQDLLAWGSIQTTEYGLGTLPWLAPERLRAEDPVRPSTASDVYALGCFFYEVFTGKIPFWEIINDNGRFSFAHVLSTEVMNGRRPQKPSPNSEAYEQYGLTEAIWSMMESCWASEEESRPTAHQLLQQPPLLNLVDNRPDTPHDE